MIFLAILLAVLPGIACGLAVCSFRPISRHVPLPILFSFGCYLGFLLLSTGIDSAKALGSYVSGHAVTTVFSVVALASLTYLALGAQRGDSSGLEVNSYERSSLGLYSLTALRPAQWTWLLIALVFITISALQLAEAPVSGWDILGSWPVHARQLIDQGLSGGVIGNYGDLQSHPTASTTLLAWASWASHSAGALGLWPWLLAAVCIWLAIYGYGLFRQQPLGAGIVATIIVATPLLENHVVVPGYSEIWLTLTSVVASALLCIAIRSQQLGVTVIAVLSALLCTWTRKTGIANTAILIIAYMGAVMYASNWLSNRNIAFFVLALTSVAGVFIFFGFNFSIAGNHIRWHPEILTLEFAGRQLEMEWQGANRVLVNEIYSKFTNMSFSTVLLAAIAALFIIIPRTSVGKREGAVGLFLACAFLGNLLLLVLAQLLSDDGIKIALPSLDTGNSRFFLPAVGITGLLVVEAIALIARKTSVVHEATVG